VTVAPIYGRRPWWHRLPIPSSWILVEGIDPRDRRESDLDDTRSYRRRYDDAPQSQPAPQVQVPLGVIVTIMIYLVGQLVGGVWWAATLQSNLQHEIADRTKEEGRLWQTVETYRLQVEALRVEIARSGLKTDSRRRLTSGQEEE